MFAVLPCFWCGSTSSADVAVLPRRLPLCPLAGGVCPPRLSVRFTTWWCSPFPLTLLFLASVKAATAAAAAAVAVAAAGDHGGGSRVWGDDRWVRFDVSRWYRRRGGAATDGALFQSPSPADEAADLMTVVALACAAVLQ